jgi:hypothetical protein
VSGPDAFRCGFGSQQPAQGRIGSGCRVENHGGVRTAGPQDRAVQSQGSAGQFQGHPAAGRRRGVGTKFGAAGRQVDDLNWPRVRIWIGDVDEGF